MYNIYEQNGGVIVAVRQLKCYGVCEGKYPKEEMVKVSGLNHCKPCAEKKEKETQDRKILHLTIQKVFRTPYPSGQMLRQIKQFQEERNYTLENMTKTICYLVKVHKKQPYQNGGLAFIPHYYDSAVKYYHDQDERRENSKDVEHKVVKIKIAPIKSETNVFKQRKLVSMEESLLYDN